MTVLTDTSHAGEFLVSEANGRRSRAQGTVLADQVLKAGQVIGAVAVGTAAGAAFASNAANTGTMGAVVVGAGAKPGVYKVVIIEPASNAGKFLVEDPDGIVVGTGNVAAEFVGGGLTFTIADGSQDFISGEGFNVTVAAGSGKWKAWNPANADGSQIACGVLWDAVDATGADKPAAAIVRDAEVNGAELEWFTGATDNNKTAGRASLALLGIIAR
ncbi:MAG: head decoration protein [Alphaproteobacteria bacterium]